MSISLKEITHTDGDVYYEVEFVNGALLGEFYREVDGYYVFLPLLRGGFWDQYVLQELSEKLLELNREWDEQIQRDLSI